MTATASPTLRLDPGFIPAASANRAYRARLAGAPTATLGIAIERENGLVTRNDVQILTDPAAHGDTLTYLARHVKFLLWAQGGCRIDLAGPADLCRALAAIYRPGGVGEFDCGIMRLAYGRDLHVAILPHISDLPAPHSAAQPIGGHLDGCRIGFDLGASDYKLAAVIDGEAIFSTEIPWDPVPQTDPAYHYTRIMDGLRLAASKLPRVDAIGGSSAGIFIDNHVKVASLFRGIDHATFARDVTGMFVRIGRDEFGVPLTIVNDGDVTALAGAMSLETTNLLGIAMGSSEAGGYIGPDGRITGWLNELAFAPVDANPDAVRDEWSGAPGVGALYFSQQAVNKLAPAAGFRFPADMGLPARLKEIQTRADAGDPAALEIFATIGVYLGHSLIHYHDYYGMENVLLLGRVTSGAGGERILDIARQTLRATDADLAERIAIHVPDERSRRVGQAVAAASLPETAAR